MDKSIIIDNIDVSGCEWYAQGATGFICADWHVSNSCNKNSNCYYKQLARLQNQYNAVVEQNKCLQAELQRKTQECEELYKRKMKLINEKLELKCKVSKLIDENATKEVTYKINGKCVKTTADKVKEITAIIQGKDCKYSRCLKALEEIEEIAATCVDVPCMEYDCDCENCKDECTENGRTCMRYGLKKILKKCEVAEVHMPSSLSLSLRERAGVRGQ